MKIEKTTKLVIEPSADLHTVFVRHNGAVALAVAGNKKAADNERTRLGEDVALLMYEAFNLGMEEGRNSRD